MFTPTIASQFHFVIMSKEFSFDMLCRGESHYVHGVRHGVDGQVIHIGVL